MSENSNLVTIKSLTDLQTEINNTATGGILFLEGYYKYQTLHSIITLQVDMEEAYETIKEPLLHIYADF